ncbi:MAG: hypothetical protein RR738_11815 [Anaerorhabdus sp.]|uniref:hypothetical protein n=1 Tax=Anaerorhabdus sp. TaxID=1872524 RepID=UPI002FC67E3B
MKTISYSNRLYLSELESQVIKEDIHLYHQMVIRSYRLIYHKNYHGLQINSLQKKVKSFYGTNDYLPLSAIHEAKALFKSSSSLHKLHVKKLDKQISRIKQKVDKTRKELEKIENQIQQLIHKTREGKQTKSDYLLEVQILKPTLKQLKSRKGQLNFRLNRVIAKQRKLTHRVPMIHFHEATSMTIPGRRQGKYSNCIFKYHLDEDTLVYRSRQQEIHLPIEFQPHSEQLKDKIKLPHNTAGKAVAYQIMDKGKYFIIKAIFDLNEIPIHTTKGNGCIGVDINVNHLAVTEINKEGNLVGTTNYPILGYNAKQRKHNLQGIIKTIIEDCAMKQKDCIVENLDFEQAKSESLYQSKRRNRMLSEFAYRQILEMFIRKGVQWGVKIEVVEPAYTSFIAKIKVTRQYGLSIHQGAAMIVARRGMGYQEKIPRQCQYFASTWKQMKQVFKNAKPTEHPLLSLIQ